MSYFGPGPVQCFSSQLIGPNANMWTQPFFCCKDATIHSKGKHTLITLLLILSSLWSLSALEPATRTLKIDSDLLIFPVADRSKLKGNQAEFSFGLIEVWVGEQLIHRCHVVHPLDVEKARFWAFLDLREIKGKEATLKLKMDRDCKMNAKDVSLILNRMENSNEMRHTMPIYKEPGRPQFHFSQIQGWSNDPNGMFYEDGLYHISWQCNPSEVYFGGWYWGHAVSKDLVHWQEAPRTLRPNGRKSTNRYPGMADGKCYSGGSAIDHNNTLGVQEGDQKTIIAMYTDSPMGESIAYSTDGGYRYTSMEDINPIVVHPNPSNPKDVRSWGRDPKPFWHEPTQKWVMVTYRQGKNPHSCSGHMVFYTSTNLKDWTFESMTEKLFAEAYEDKNEQSDNLKKDYHECPEFVELPVDGDVNRKKWVMLDASPKYQVGEFDGKVFRPDEKAYRWSIFGRMKAGQCFSNAPDGRAIFMIWSRLDYGRKVPFASGFTLPLELSLKTAEDGVRLYANPVKELEALRQEEIFNAKDRSLSNQETVKFKTQESRVEVLVTIKTTSKKGYIELAFGSTKLYYFLKEKRLCDRPFPQNDRDHCYVYDKDDGEVHLRLYLDDPSWEIFVENGAVYKIGGRRDMGKPLGEISVRMSEGEGSLSDMRVYSMKTIWPDNVTRLTYGDEEISK
jgi:fructan beta-fructosidase